MYKALYLSPMIPSFNIPETVRFFIDLFGFSLLMHGDYSIVKKDEHLTHILRAGQENISLQADFFNFIDKLYT